MKKLSYKTTCQCKPELEYFIQLLEQNYEVSLYETTTSEADVNFGNLPNNSFFADSNFLEFRSQTFKPNNFLKHTDFIYHQDQEDIPATVFFLINCLQERNVDFNQLDHLGRYNPEFSFQVNQQKVQVNYVGQLIDSYVEKFLPSIANLKKKTPSKIFLSHDMDTIFGSLRQDTFWAVRNLKLDTAFKVFLKNIFQKPEWLNIDQIMKIESEYDYTSTFFWMTERGKTINNLSNSDYNISNTKVKAAIHTANVNGWGNGLHKGIGPTTFNEELQKLPLAVKSNRYHYLYFNPHVDYDKIANAGLLLDCTLGFADRIGMRNSYGLPFSPFNYSTLKPYSFVECPLHMMDTTYHYYNKKGANEFVKDVISFVEANRTNCVLSLLIHNNYISGYKFQEYLKAFKSLLAYFYDNNFRSINETEIITSYGTRN
ncbi:MAG: hypothetical protein U0T84_01175 [Chitinophagales bacterium]